MVGNTIAGRYVDRYNLPIMPGELSWGRGRCDSLLRLRSDELPGSSRRLLEIHLTEQDKSSGAHPPEPSADGKTR